MFGWHSKGIGFTLDVHNRAPTPVVLRLSRAVLHGAEIGGPAQFSISPVNNGAGALPVRVEDRPHGTLDITLPPGQQATLWVLFGERQELDPWRGDRRRFRASIVIPTSSGTDVVVPVDDAREAPHLERWPLHTGVSFGASTSVFGSGTDSQRQYVLAPFNVGIWHLRAPFLFRFSSAWTEVLELVDEQVAADSGITLSLTAAWIPRSAWMGLDAGAGVMSLDNGNTTWSGRSPLFTASLGLVWTLGRVQGVPCTWRVGYLHNFSAPGDRHGTYFSIEVPLVLF